MSINDSLQSPACDMRARAVVAATYLQVHGFTQDQLRSIHHSQGETFNKFFGYFGEPEKRPMLQNNVSYANRIIFIAECHAANAGTFDELVAAALERWPL